MPQTDGERLAAIEQILADVRGDVTEIRAQQERTRGRLHDLEGVTGLLVAQEKDRIRMQDMHLRRLGIKIQWLALAVGVSGLLMSVALVVVTGH